VVRKGEVFVEYEAKVLSRVSGIKSGVVDSGQLFTDTTHTHAHPFNGPLSRTTRASQYQKSTRRSAIAEGPCDASC